MYSIVRPSIDFKGKCSHFPHQNKTTLAKPSHFDESNNRKLNTKNEQGQIQTALRMGMLKTTMKGILYIANLFRDRNKLGKLTPSN